MITTDLAIELRQKGHRLTPAKRATIEYFLNVKVPFSAQDLIEHLNKLGFNLNKTTVYRQLESFTSEEILGSVNLNDGVTRYELKHNECHHHIVCKECGKVSHIQLGDRIKTLQTELSLQSGFVIEEHMLEFFGKCIDCN